MAEDSQNVPSGSALRRKLHQLMFVVAGCAFAYGCTMSLVAVLQAAKAAEDAAEKSAEAVQHLANQEYYAQQVIVRFNEMLERYEVAEAQAEYQNMRIEELERQLELIRKTAAAYGLRVRDFPEEDGDPPEGSD